MPRANHSLKVYGYAKAIAAGETLGSQEQQVLEAAALLHDLGIHEALRRYGHCQGPRPGGIRAAHCPSYTDSAWMAGKAEEQVAFLVGHHHSYQTVGGGVPLQILFEADLLVNAEEGSLSSESLISLEKQVIRTSVGRELFSLLLARQ